MNNVISNNAYGILGLLPNSSQKDILRRAKEIEKLSKIGENLEYQYDFKFYDKVRNLRNIKIAEQNISNIEEHILHYFFRIYIESNEVKVLNYLDKNLNDKNILIYYNENLQGINFKKNIAIMATIALIENRLIEKTIVEFNAFCVNLWAEILNNDKYLNDFKKLFLLDDEIGIDESYFNNIREKIIKKLTQIFSDISKKYNNNAIIANFIRKFKINDNQNIDLVEVIYESIEKNIEILNDLNISEDGIFDDDEKRILRSCLETFRTDFNKLQYLSLYDSEKSILVREKVAEALRRQMLDLYNELGEDKASLELAEFVSQIAGTSASKQKYDEEYKYLQGSKERNANFEKLKKIFDDINEKITNMENNPYYINTSVAITLNTIENNLKEIYQNSDIPTAEIDHIVDIFAIRLRGIAITVHNDYQKISEANILLNSALRLARTQKTREIIREDMSVLESNAEIREKNQKAQDGDIVSQLIGWAIMIGIFLLIKACD